MTMVKDDPFANELARRLEDERHARFEGETCSSTLPSAAAAETMLEAPTAANVAKVAASVAARAGIIGVGLAIAGERAHIVRNAIAGSLAIETFVLGYLTLKRKR